MLTFPTLKTGAIAQYPVNTSEAFGNEVLQFLGGGEQRYRSAQGPLKRWTLQLSMLDEAEMNLLDDFFSSASGSFATFNFADPRTGALYPNCFVESDVLTETFEGELRTGTTLVIRQGRS